jgi:hypothetical protein
MTEEGGGASDGEEACEIPTVHRRAAQGPS